MGVVGKIYERNLYQHYSFAGLCFIRFGLLNKVIQSRKISYVYGITFQNFRFVLGFQ